MKALAYLATKNGNRFNATKDLNELNKLLEMIKKGKNIDDFYGQNKYYQYYGSLSFIFAEFIGEYVEEGSNEIKYGLKIIIPSQGVLVFSLRRLRRFKVLRL